MISAEELREEVAGRPLPEGSYTIEPYVAWLMADSVESPPLPEGIAHPMFTFFGTQGGMGVTLDEMFAMCHASSDDGVMLGTTEIDLQRPLRVGERFTVRGQMDDVVRKQGSIGTFDIIGFHLDLVDADDAVAATATIEFIYPRRS